VRVTTFFRRSAAPATSSAGKVLVVIMEKNKNVKRKTLMLQDGLCPYAG
jgi:hypothetical protein